MTMSEHASGVRQISVEEATEWIAVPESDTDKYARGVLGVVTGSATYPGAAILGVQAAMRTGLGMLRYIGDDRAADAVLRSRPEIVTAPGRVQAWLLGSGMDAGNRSAAADVRLKDALGQDVPVVVDAGALDLVGRATGPAIITPHFRELARVLEHAGHPASTEQIAADPAQFARLAAQILGVSVLLKGNTTYVASPDGECLSASFGTPWLATAGTGDVLGGVLGALVATHADVISRDGHGALLRLGATAAAVHGMAATRASAGGPIVALDVADALPATIAQLISP